MRNLSKWSRLYYLLRARLNIPILDLKSNTEIELTNRLKMWGKGFLSEKHYYYSLNKNDFRDYLTDHQRAAARFINHPYTEILNSKLLFEMAFSKVVKVPKTYGVILDGLIYLLGKNGYLELKGNSDQADFIEDLCQKHGKIVLKPIMGAFGKGVMVASRISSNEYLVNLKEFNRENLNNSLKKLNNYLITEFIKQGNHPDKLYPSATNTLRILTMYDYKKQEPFIAAAARRIGTDTSAPLDNNARGGMTVNINIDSGMLGPAAQLAAKGLIWHDRHPDTAVNIKGEITPSWPRIKSKLLELANGFPYLKYVGWDIVDTNNDIVFLEGNNQSNVRVWQIHNPLLKDQRAKDFFRYHKVIN